MKDHRGAAFYAGTLCALQESSDVVFATNFEADVVKEYCGVFNVKNMRVGGLTGGACKNFAELEPTKGFYAFKSYNYLYRLGEQVKLESDNAEIFATAAVGDGGVGLVAANRTDGAIKVAFDLTGVKGALAVRMTDKEHTNAVMNEIEAGDSLRLTLTLPANSFVYVGTDLPDPVSEYTY